VELEYQDIDHTHSSTSHVVAIALQAMKAPRACATISNIEEILCHPCG